MAETDQYAHGRRRRNRCLVEFLVLAAVTAVVAVVAIAALIVLLVYGAGSVSLWGALAVLAAGGAVLWFWMWVTDHWDGSATDEIANEGRAGRVQTVQTADGVPLHVEIEDDEGSGDADVTVFLCHALGSSAAAWRAQRAALAGERVRVVSYDMRGHGTSGQGNLDEKVRGLRQLADDLGRVIDATAPQGYVVIAPAA